MRSAMAMRLSVKTGKLIPRVSFIKIFFMLIKTNIYLMMHSYLETHSQNRKEGRKEMFYLTMHSTYLVMVIWRQTYG